jgi:hypothetical protein
MRSVTSEMGRKSGCRALAHALLWMTIFVSGSTLAKPVNEEKDAYNPMLDDKFSLWIGGFFPNVKSTIRLDSNSITLPGDEIDFENFLGLEDSKSVLWGGFRWHANYRNQLEVEINNLNRTGSVSASTGDVNIGDQTIIAGAQIDTQFDLALVRLTYGFSVIRKQKHDLAVKAGVHMAFVGLKIDAFGDIQDVDTGMTVCNPSPCQASIETSDYTLPLPHLGLSYTYAITPKWGLRTQALGFAIKIGDIKGTMAEFDLDVHYQPWEHVGFGGGLRYWDLTVEYSDDGSEGGYSPINGEFQYKYWGPALYILGSF